MLILLFVCYAAAFSFLCVLSFQSAFLLISFCVFFILLSVLSFCKSSDLPLDLTSSPSVYQDLLQLPGT